MKKFIQIFSFIFLSVFVSIISVNAQTRQYKAEIPFDFKIGQKSYRSGSYRIAVQKASNGNPMLILKNKDGKNLHIVSGISSDAARGEARLTFSRTENQMYLTGLATSETNLPIAKPKTGKLIAKNNRTGRSAPKNVSIALK